MADRVFATDGNWAVGSDGVQWILMQRRTRRGVPFWNPVWFVRSTKDILALGMAKKGVGALTARLLLAGLPDTFDQWKAAPSRLEHLDAA
jgi:hypothetical protein